MFNLLEKGAKFIKILKEYAVVLGFVASIFIGVVSLIVVNSVQPIIKNVDDLSRKVEATETRVDSHADSNAESFKSINDKMDRILQSMNNTNAKLNQVIGKLEIIERR